jgi:hypothetical protein
MPSTYHLSVPEKHRVSIPIKIHRAHIMAPQAMAASERFSDIFGGHFTKRNTFMLILRFQTPQCFMVHSLATFHDGLGQLNQHSIWVLTKICESPNPEFPDPKLIHQKKKMSLIFMVNHHS